MLMRRSNASFIKQNYRHALETSVLELKKKGMLLNGQFVIMCSDSTVARKCKVRETQLPKTTVETKVIDTSSLSEIILRKEKKFSITPTTTGIKQSLLYLSLYLTRARARNITSESAATMERELSVT